MRCNVRRIDLISNGLAASLCLSFAYLLISVVCNCINTEISVAEFKGLRNPFSRAPTVQKCTTMSFTYRKSCFTLENW